LSNGSRAAMSEHKGWPVTRRKVDWGRELAEVRVTYFPKENYVHNIYYTRTDGKTFDLTSASP